MYASGTFIIVEMLITFIATLAAVGMMYLQSMGAFKHNAPEWLLKITFIKHQNINQVEKLSLKQGIVVCYFNLANVIYIISKVL